MTAALRAPRLCESEIDDVGALLNTLTTAATVDRQRRRGARSRRDRTAM